MPTSIFPGKRNDKSDTTISFSNSILGVVAFGLLLALPTGVHAWFDGLPWTGEVETLALSVIIPFLLIVQWKFLSQRLSILFIFALLIFKAILFLGSPSSGLLVKISPNLPPVYSDAFYVIKKQMPFKRVEGGSWVKTYATFWSENASAVYQTPWNQKLDFPMDWVLLRKGQCKQKSQVEVDCFAALSATIEVEGALLNPNGKKFALIARGVQEGTLIATNEHGNSFALKTAKNHNDVTQPQYHLPANGRWKISGKLTYIGADWSFIPVFIENNGQLTTDLGRDVLWQNYDELSNSLPLTSIYKYLSFIVDCGIVIFLFIWIASTLKHMIRRQVLTLALAIFSISAVCIPYLMASFLANVLKIVHLSDPTSISYLGISILIAGVSFLLWSYWQKDHRNFRTDRIIPTIYLLFGPTLLFYFTDKWWLSIGQWRDWGIGDDWITYQYLARKIMVEGEWLRAGEGVFIVQPLYRYIVGIYHWLFGQSAFVQSMADAWCILGAAVLIAAIAVKLRISPVLAFITSITYLAINFVGSFRYLIGRGLQENHAMIFMVLAAWYLCRAREGGAKPIILATVFGILGYWTRQDHLGAIAFLAFLMLEPVTDPTRNWKCYWDRFQVHWRKIAVYWGFGISSVLLLCFRNWLLGGAFFPAAADAGNWGGTYETAMYYLILTGNYWPKFPSISGFIVTSGVFVALLALIWRPKPLLNFPLSLGVIFIGLLAPYAVLYVGGYVPRFSIHILPLALISLAVLLNNLHFFKSLIPKTSQGSHEFH